MRSRRHTIITATLSAATALALLGSLPGTAAAQSESSAQAQRRGLSGVVTVTLGEASVGNYQARTAFCPTGKKLISGGVTTSQLGGVAVMSRPSDTGAGWVVSGRTGNGNGNIGVGAWAVCADPPAGYEVVRTQYGSVPNGQRNRVACPAGKVIMSAGGEARGGLSGLNAVYPEADTSTGAYRAVAAGSTIATGGTSVGLVVVAVCSSPHANYQLTRHPAISANSGSYKSVSCPGLTANSAGLDVGNGFITSLIPAEPYSPAPSAGTPTWTFNGYVRGQSTVTFTPTLICS
ncbi:hypothetical protein [Nonomuraea typhae]|uniref:Uncharacterized protein n=1 Tax=Nonomuraea typhae TaxID=2603600 RepID=A0ABW7ZC17_9ACTN